MSEYIIKEKHLAKIVRCKECEYREKDPDGDPWCGYLKRHVNPSDFCSWGWKDDFVTCKCGEDIERHDRIQTCPSCGRVVYA